MSKVLWFMIGKVESLGHEQCPNPDTKCDVVLRHSNSYQCDYYLSFNITVDIKQFLPLILLCFTAHTFTTALTSGVARSFGVFGGRGGRQTENFPTKGCANIGICIITVGRPDKDIFRQQLEMFDGGSCLPSPLQLHHWL